MPDNDQTTPVVPQTPDPTNLEAIGKSREVAPEDDPNLALQTLIAKRHKKPDEKAAKTEENKEKEPEKPGSPPTEKLSGLIANALKFRSKKEEKEPEPAKTEETAKESDGAGDETTKAGGDSGAAPVPTDSKSPDKEPKTIVTKRKREQPLPDPVQIATAAATAAVQAATNANKGAAPAEKTPEEGLTEDDRYEYEVAKYLAKTDPKYKEAPALFLANLNKSRSYASRWETANPGKIFDPEDEEHDEFYEQLRQPWADRDFRRAEAAMARSPREEEMARELQTLKTENAKIELSGAVQKATIMTADQLAKAAGEDVHKKISTNWKEFSESDPITSGILTETLNGIAPLIETIVQIDDPKGRIPFDQNNPLHQDWYRLLQEKEAQYSGLRDDAGKLFATRSEWYSLNQAQRRNRWFLTPDHLLSELIADASETVTERIKAEMERQKKIALSLGYVPREGKSDGTAPSATTNKEDDKKKEKAGSGAEKPVSPTVGSGAKIDDKGEQRKTGHSKFLETTASILFKR